MGWSWHPCTLAPQGHGWDAGMEGGCAGRKGSTIGWSCGRRQGDPIAGMDPDMSDSEGSVRGVSGRKGQSAGDHQQVLKKLREAS